MTLLRYCLNPFLANLTYDRSLFEACRVARPATGKPITMRVMHMLRREGELFKENWVFIDILELFMQMDYDILGNQG